jgi:deferrochelatase/peroxidase EfeB
VAAGVELTSGSSASPLLRVALPAQPAGLPLRQHAWEYTLARDDDGNAVAPRHDRLLMFNVNGTPNPGYARVLEAELRRLEQTYRWAPSGLLFTVGWSHAYFTRALGVSSPIPEARPLSDFELPGIDHYDCCIHLACDDGQRLAEVEALLVTRLVKVLVWQETRTGFTGDGLPAANQDVGGIPPGDPVPLSAPLFMGFRSGLKRNQATEDYVTIPDGPFAGGTTQHVSHMRLDLGSWYGQLSYEERVTRMFAPQVSPAQEASFKTDAESDPAGFEQAVHKYSVIGHSQTSARARVDGKPIILRRDFDTVDGGQAGLHFVALQRTIEDFVKVRTAMNAASAQLQNPAITATANNGINAFIFVVRRANYILPVRESRSFPLLPGREQALQ